MDHLQVAAAGIKIATKTKKVVAAVVANTIVAVLVAVTKIKSLHRVRARANKKVHLLHLPLRIRSAIVRTDPVQVPVRTKIKIVIIKAHRQAQVHVTKTRIVIIRAHRRRHQKVNIPVLVPHQNHRQKISNAKKLLMAILLNQNQFRNQFVILNKTVSTMIHSQ